MANRADVEALRKELYEEPLSPEEFDRRLSQALAEEDEIQAALELCRWFKRRYPTAKERLDYARQKYAEWMRSARPR